MTNVQNLNIPKYNSIVHLAPPGAYTSSMVKCELAAAVFDIDTLPEV